MTPDDQDLNDELLFFEDAPSAEDKALQSHWKVLIVDDEKEIHNVTELALRKFTYQDKSIAFIHAYSGAEGRKCVAENSDTALVLLDVVMEEEDAGLQLAKYIREELQNRSIQIILRTGQPGQAPEEKVIVDYDINDYKAKTELTKQRLFTTVVASLRAYKHIASIEQSRIGLRQIVESSFSLFKVQSLENFINGVLTQMVSLLNLGENSLYCQATGFVTQVAGGDFSILAGTGIYQNKIQQNVFDVVPARVQESLKRAVSSRTNLYTDDYMVIFIRANDACENLIYLEGGSKLRDNEKELIDLFCRNVQLAFENAHLING